MHPAEPAGTREILRGNSAAGLELISPGNGLQDIRDAFRAVDFLGRWFGSPGGSAGADCPVGRRFQTTESRGGG